MKFAKAACLLAAMVSILSFPVKASATAQGTSGTELNVVQAQKVEIQLGTNWTGVEFEMKTDAGMYPDTIPVGEDGILRFEVGGSESYILTCLNSDVALPSPETPEGTIPVDTESVEATGEETLAPDETQAIDSTGEDTQNTDPTELTEPADVPEDAEQIPVVYIVITAVGILLAIGALVYLFMNKKNEQADFEDDDL